MQGFTGSGIRVWGSWGFRVWGFRGVVSDIEIGLGMVTSSIPL